MLSVTDGLFRETVRSVPSLPENEGKFEGVEIAEQLVDSAVYRYGTLSPVPHLFTYVCFLDYSGNLSRSQDIVELEPCFHGPLGFTT